ncbi:MAG: NUDIX domain-containing protein [Patescibacteria group bacterium]
MADRQVKVAVNAFVVRDDKLLLGKRKNIAGNGTWGGLPGGHVEYMESLEVATKMNLRRKQG